MTPIGMPIYVLIVGKEGSHVSMVINNFLVALLNVLPYTVDVYQDLQFMFLKILYVTMSICIYNMAYKCIRFFNLLHQSLYAELGITVLNVTHYVEDVLDMKCQ